MILGGAVEWLDRRLYPGVGDNWDDELFRARILEHLRPQSRVLDIGAGAGIVAQMRFRGLAAKVTGVDLDPRVTDNPHLDAAHVCDAGRLPLADGSIDLAFADNVLEHLEDPAAVFAEIARALAPGGVFLAKTPNRWGYVALAARATPTGFHRAYNRLRGRAAADTFPTRYRANSRRDLTRAAQSAGLELERLEHVDGRPEYMRLTPVTYAVGAAYERLLRLPALAALRTVLIATFRKPVA